MHLICICWFCIVCWLLVVVAVGVLLMVSVAELLVDLIINSV